MGFESSFLKMIHPRLKMSSLGVLNGTLLPVQCTTFNQGPPKKVVHYVGNRGPLGTQAWLCVTAMFSICKGLE